MTVINFAHPLTDDQKKAIEQETGLAIERMLLVDTQIDTLLPLQPQVAAWLDGLGVASSEWQSEAVLMVLPSLSASTAVLLAELHGRMGHFPAIVRLRPAVGAVVPRFDVAEIINLQAVREGARASRSEN